MPFLYSDNGFNLANLNLHTIYGQTHDVVTRPGTSIPFGPPAIPLGGTSFAIPSMAISFDSGLALKAGTLSVLLAGDGLTANGQGALNGGVLKLFAQAVSGKVDVFVGGLALAGAAYNAAAATIATADDIALFTSLLTGNDLITLSVKGDRFDAGGGDDLILDEGGADRIAGGAGNDLILADKGNDKLDAGNGDDFVGAGSGNASIQGGKGDDLIWAGAGNDSVSGGTGADIFVFEAGDGVDHISGFVAADDQILLMGPTLDLADLRIVQAGSNVKVTFGDVTVFLDGIQRSAVTRADFSLGGEAALATAAQEFFDGWTYV